MKSQIYFSPQISFNKETRKLKAHKFKKPKGSIFSEPVLYTQISFLEQNQGPRTQQLDLKGLT